MSLSVSVHITREERVSQTFSRKSEHAFYVPKIVLFIKQSGKILYRQTGRKRFACWLNKTRIKTHTHYLIVIVYFFLGNNGCYLRVV